MEMKQRGKNKIYFLYFMDLLFYSLVYPSGISRFGAIIMI